MANLNNGKLELLTGKNSFLVLVDYKPSMFRSIWSGNKSLVMNAVVGATKAANILNISVVLSSINPSMIGIIQRQES